MRDLTAAALPVVVVLAAAAGIILLLWRSRVRRKASRMADPARDYAVRTDWGAQGRGTINYSSFVYFDVDRDGTYGVRDRPMAGVMVRLYDSAGKLVSSTRTNNAGFANFPMSTKGRKAVIRKAGSWRFAVSVPPGWLATGANATQSRQMLPEAGSPTGLVSREMLSPVGLAPPRRLRGRLADGVSATLSVMSAGEPVETMLLASGAAFAVDLPDGADTVHVTGGGIDRSLALSPYPADLGLLSPGRGSIASDAALETIGFDEVTARTFRKVPTGYAGLDWRNLNAMSRDYTRDSQGYVNGNVSGDHVAYTSSGLAAEFGGDKAFGFHSVMLTAAWLNAEGETALIECWLGDELVASDEVTLSAMTPLHYVPMLQHVTRVRLSTRHHWQLVMDDLVLAR